MTKGAGRAIGPPFDERLIERLELEVGFPSILELIWDPTDTTFCEIVDEAHFELYPEEYATNEDPQHYEGSFDQLVSECQRVARAVERLSAESSPESGEHDKGDDNCEVPEQLPLDDYVEKVREHTNALYSTLVALRAVDRGNIDRIRALWNQELFEQFWGLKLFTISPITRFLTSDQVIHEKLDPSSYAGYPLRRICYDNEGSWEEEYWPYQTRSSFCPRLTGEREELEIELDQGSRVVTACRDSQRGLVAVPFLFPDSEEFPCNFYQSEVLAWEDSVLHKVKHAAGELTRDFPWSLAQATTFLVAGWVPNINYLSGEVAIDHGKGYDQAWVRMTISPSVSPKEVEKYYRKLRNQLRGTDSKNQPRSMKTLKATQFIASDYLRCGLLTEQRRSRQDILKSWNDSRSNPGDQYRQLNTFDSAYSKTAASVLRIDEEDIVGDLSAERLTKNTRSKAFVVGPLMIDPVYYT